MTTVSKTSLDVCALAMISNTYFFEHRNPLYPILEVIGDARVTAVLINENSPPELLLEPILGEDQNFYPIQYLSFSSSLAAVG
jgi:hypothetical protein